MKKNISFSPLATPFLPPLPSLIPCEGSTTAQIEVRGQRSGWPSPLGVISPVVIWLAEMLASPANLISEPGGRLGQITFLFRTDWTYGEMNVQSCDSERSWLFLMIEFLLFYTARDPAGIWEYYYITDRRVKLLSRYYKCTGMLFLVALVQKQQYLTK